MTTIRFGTDGWRAILDQEFIPENVVRVVQAFCDLNASAANKTVFVGFDRRRKSPETAELVARVLGSNGFAVRLSSQYCPTPCVSWLVKTHQALAGIMVTASHNPAQWNGIKFKESYGGAASPEYTKKIETQIAMNDAKAPREYLSLAELEKTGRVSRFDPHTTYVTHLRNFIDVEAINKSPFKISVDPLFGAGTGFMRAVLQKDILEIHAEVDTNFGGLNPEPIAKNLRPFCEFVVKNGADIGLATDGDADRIGAVDKNGNVISSQQIFALLLRHHVTHRKLTGPVVKSVSSTVWIERLCRKYGLPVIETPIGFKYISQELLKNNALMGGEESGGISLREHVHERDGVLNGLLLAEMMAVNGKSLESLLHELYEDVGFFYYDRHDYHLDAPTIAAVQRKLQNVQPEAMAGKKCVRINSLDGTKMIFEDDSWLLIRASGTEPLLRVYAEAPSQKDVENLLASAKERFLQH